MKTYFPNTLLRWFYLQLITILRSRTSEYLFSFFVPFRNKWSINFVFCCDNVLLNTSLIIIDNTAFQIAGYCSVLFWPPLPVPLEFFSRVLSRGSVVVLDTKLIISFSTLLIISLVRSRFSLRRTDVDVFFVSLKIKKIK